MTERIKNLPAEPWAQWVRFIGAVIIIPAVAWGVWMERRVTFIEGSRATSHDLLTVMEAVNEKADRSDVPPPEVRATLARLEAQMDESNRLMADIRERLARLEGR